jgi:hypothetical protein
VSGCRRHRPERPDALPILLALLPAESLPAMCQEGRKFFIGGRARWQQSLATRLGHRQRSSASRNAVGRSEVVSFVVEFEVAVLRLMPAFW